MDVYDTETKTDATVVIVAGFPGAYNDLPFVRSLGQKLAASGLRAIAYANREPQSDLQALLAQLDTPRIALWATSGNGPVALSALMQDAPARVRCAVFHYAYTFDAGAAAKQFGFVDGCAGKSMDDLRGDVPIFVSRAGQDQFAGLNASLDQFVAGALARNMPITVVNHASGAHAFDISEDSDVAREIIRQSIDFAAFHLNQAPAA